MVMGLLSKTLLAMTVLLLTNGIVSGATVSAVEVEKEIANIEAADHVGADGIFFIRIFNGLIPIPNRFVINHVTLDGIIELHSMILGTTPQIPGSITVGPYDKFASRYSNRLTKLKHTDSILSGLHVSVYDTPKGVPIQAEEDKTIVIHDDKQFILILDQNKDLWNAMLKAYVRFGNQ
jgi:hypothetical protein